MNALSALYQSMMRGGGDSTDGSTLEPSKHVQFASEVYELHTRTDAGDTHLDTPTTPVQTRDRRPPTVSTPTVSVGGSASPRYAVSTPPAPSPAKRAASLSLPGGEEGGNTQRGSRGKTIAKGKGPDKPLVSVLRHRPVPGAAPDRLYPSVVNPTPGRPSRLGERYISSPRLRQRRRKARPTPERRRRQAMRARRQRASARVPSPLASPGGAEGTGPGSLPSTPTRSPRVPVVPQDVGGDRDEMDMDDQPMQAPVSFEWQAEGEGENGAEREREGEDGGDARQSPSPVPLSPSPRASAEVDRQSPSLSHHSQLDTHVDMTQVSSYAIGVRGMGSRSRSRSRVSSLSMLLGAGQGREGKETQAPPAPLSSRLDVSGVHSATGSRHQSVSPSRAPSPCHSLLSQSVYDAFRDRASPTVERYQEGGTPAASDGEAVGRDNSPALSIILVREEEEVVVVETAVEGERVIEEREDRDEKIDAMPSISRLELSPSPSPSPSTLPTLASGISVEAAVPAGTAVARAGVGGDTVGAGGTAVTQTGVLSGPTSALSTHGQTPSPTPFSPTPTISLVVSEAEHEQEREREEREEAALREAKIIREREEEERQKAWEAEKQRRREEEARLSREREREAARQKEWERLRQEQERENREREEERHSESVGVDASSATATLERTKVAGSALPAARTPSTVSDSATALAPIPAPSSPTPTETPATLPSQHGSRTVSTHTTHRSPSPVETTSAVTSHVTATSHTTMQGPVSVSVTAPASVSAVASAPSVQQSIVETETEHVSERHPLPLAMGGLAPSPDPPAPSPSATSLSTTVPLSASMLRVDSDTTLGLATPTLGQCHSDITAYTRGGLVQSARVAPEYPAKRRAPSTPPKATPARARHPLSTVMSVPNSFSSADTSSSASASVATRVHASQVTPSVSMPASMGVEAPENVRKRADERESGRESGRVEESESVWATASRIAASSGTPSLSEESFHQTRSLSRSPSRTPQQSPSPRQSPTLSHHSPSHHSPSHHSLSRHSPSHHSSKEVPQSDSVDRDGSVGQAMDFDMGGDVDMDMGPPEEAEDIDINDMEGDSGMQIEMGGARSLVVNDASVPAPSGVSMPSAAPVVAPVPVVPAARVRPRRHSSRVLFHLFGIPLTTPVSLPPVPTHHIPGASRDWGFLTFPKGCGRVKA
ncbi:hypothetical protein KIPB_004263 [Kipferlia bialata]|uniref:Uncharacterized protein n=1 Tax=Kipferlia bialata TaxID=797122 RepID=A0A9K3CVE6_9EUKA|nr:hypothetical protein KIPB_004263 [Kipferlia bialata]|eukprot:g4263.t1